ncbi:MAG TPA: nucleoside triphosphate pyrophosphohydrolase [Beijerinckia sp.]|nr:nucleoside triphosphate pyrophosphohydrolase [Beijerinckia sp.]
MQPSRDIGRLIEIMAALRTPETGCPWDIQQNFATIAPYTIEEAYEIADAIARHDLSDLKDELGDLLLQVVFHARMAEEQEAFDFGAVVEAITTKMIRRHPHVFGDALDLSPDAIKSQWAKIKAEEKAAKQAARGTSAESKPGFLADVPLPLPGLTRAVKLQAKASAVGFDWNDARLVLEKIREETREIEVALDEGKPAAIQDEIGDLLFAVANLARHLHIDPESAIRSTNAKFEKRFHFIEQELHRAGRALGEVTLDEMDALWNDAKAQEKPSGS